MQSSAPLGEAESERDTLDASSPHGRFEII